MHSHPHGHLLEQLGSLYGTGTLSDRRDRFIYATPVDQTDDYGGTDRLGQTIGQDLERTPVADHPIVETVLADPQDDAVVEIMARGRYRIFVDNS